MRPEAHLSVVNAEVRGHDLPRHGGAKLDSGRAFALVSAMGVPRLWGLVVGAVVDGFTEGLDRSDSGGARRLEQALEWARERLTRRCDALIERNLPDATLIGIYCDHAELHVITVGPARVYLHRRGQPQRLTPREDPPEGLLRGVPVRCSVAIEPEDVILAGSVSAFSVRAIGKLASVLEADPRTAPPVLASLLTEPASRAGVGAVALALRIR